MLEATSATDLSGANAPHCPSVASSGANPFVHVHDGRIVDAHGTPLLLRGMGLGNWLLPEGYMWGFGDDTASPRQIEDLFLALLGEPGAEAFWEQFRSRFITRTDIARIAGEGFDHVRLPINWRVLMTPDGAWREDGFACVERLVGWCRDHGLTVLLDLHGAPGGQTGTNIDDSLGRPELFMDERNVDLTIALWTEIARRYRDEETVLGYDLLNEPLPDEWQHRYAAELVTLYRRITAAIRAVDPHHLIMYEGMHWATNWDIFTEVWDANSVLQFHKYWSPADRPSIQRFVDVGGALGLPIYMGEGGENTPEWLAAAFQLYEDTGVGWNFWPWKKIDTHSSPCSITPPAGWERVVEYASGGEALSRAEAERIVGELLVALDVGACEYRSEVVHALFRRAPVRLPAYAFTFRGQGRSFGTSTGHPHPGLRPDDGVTLRRRDSRAELDFHYPPAEGPEATIVADLGQAEWLAFEVELPRGTWVVTVETDAPTDVTSDAVPPGVPEVTIGDVVVPLVASVPSEGPPGLALWTGPFTQSSRERRTVVRLLATGGPLTVVAVALACDAAR